MTMPRPRYPNTLREKTRHGAVVWYFRLGKGKRVRLQGDYGSPEWLASYNAALAWEQAPQAKGGPASGSIAWLIARYRQSATWAALASATRRQRDLIFAGIIAKAGTAPYRGVTAKTIRRGRDDRALTPFMANNYLKAVRGLFAWACEAEYVSTDPAKDVAFLPARTEGHEPWTMADVARYRARWPLGTRERVWMEVLLMTGFRLGDACTVGHQHVSAGWIRLRTEKTDAWAEIPVLPALAEAVAAGPTADLAWISNAWGRPFVKEAFGNAFRAAAKAAGITGKSAHGLRKTLASHAAELGASDEQMQAWFAWTSSRMSSIYTRGANRKRMAGSLGDLLKQNAPATEHPRTLLPGAGNVSKTAIKSKR